MIVMWVHLFPSRTQKLSTCTPTILGGRLPGKIGNANTKPRLKSRGFFLAKTCHRHVFYARTILGLPGKPGNANTKPRLKSRGFFLAKTCHRHVFYARTILGLPGKIGNANTKTSPEMVRFFLACKCPLDTCGRQGAKGTSSASLRSQYLAYPER